jgi:hypothetical protein
VSTVIMPAKLLAVLLIIFTCLGQLLAADPPKTAAKPTGEIQVLFIGNSLTYGNDLPKMLAELAKAGKQRTLRHKSETPGGCTLEKHWKDGKALAQIRAARWDFVILQEQSQFPLGNRASMFEYGQKLDAEVKKQGAKTILYTTWALQDKPEQQPALTAAYQKLAKELKAQVARVGPAWEAALANDKTLALHAPDKKHPTKAGTYLAACVFYATIYGQSPEGLPGRIGGLTDDQARPLQAIAWKVVQEAK